MNNNKPVKATNVNLDTIEEVFINFPNWTLYDNEGSIIFPFKYKEGEEVEPFQYLLERLDSLGPGIYIVKVPRYTAADFDKLEGRQVSAAYRINSIIYRFKYLLQDDEEEEEVKAAPVDKAKISAPPAMDFKNGGLDIMSLLQWQAQQQQFFLQQQTQHAEQQQAALLGKMEDRISQERNLHELEMQIIKERFEREEEEQENSVISGLNSLERTDIIAMFSTLVDTVKGAIQKKPIAGTQEQQKENDLIAKLKKYLPGTVEELEKTVNLAETNPAEFEKLINQNNADYDEFAE